VFAAGAEKQNCWRNSSASKKARSIVCNVRIVVPMEVGYGSKIQPRRGQIVSGRLWRGASNIQNSLPARRLSLLMAGYAEPANAACPTRVSAKIAERLMV
jgi:hypothetical protein